MKCQRSSNKTQTIWKRLLWCSPDLTTSSTTSWQEKEDSCEQEEGCVASATEVAGITDKPTVDDGNNGNKGNDGINSSKGKIGSNGKDGNGTNNDDVSQAAGKLWLKEESGMK